MNLRNCCCRQVDIHEITVVYQGDTNLTENRGIDDYTDAVAQHSIVLLVLPNKHC